MKKNINKKEEKRRKRYRPGEKALKEIRRYQKSTANLMPRQPFRRLAREVISEITWNSLRLETQAATALQEPLTDVPYTQIESLLCPPILSLFAGSFTLLAIILFD
ncbi:hypothetical protein niasHT_009323 [Heterodera trifolii]|uniref:Core Histone H2A/H2B/H3 domain-containing protein n=1 Tax=Heterodera trifolii TaxID=157864 RepID=A0ABD2LU15_9BILA